MDIQLKQRPYKLFTHTQNKQTTGKLTLDKGPNSFVFTKQR